MFETALAGVISNQDETSANLCDIRRAGKRHFQVSNPSQAVSGVNSERRESMPRFTSGWYKSYREAWEKDLSSNIFLWGIWNALLHMATWKESQLIDAGKQRILPPGTVVLGLREMSEKWECSVSTIWKWLHYLRDTGRITLETRTRGTIVTLCNWELYQNEDSEVRTRSEHGPNTERTPAEHGANSIEEGKKVRIEEGKKVRIKESKKSNVGIRTDYPPDFEDLWNLYGKRGDKKAALQEYKRLGLSDTEKVDLKTAITNYTASTSDIQYRKHMARFLKMDWREVMKVTSINSGIDWAAYRLKYGIGDAE